MLKAVQQLHAAHAVVRVTFLNLLKDLNLVQRSFCVVLGALHDLQRHHIVRFAAMWRLRKSAAQEASLPPVVAQPNCREVTPTQLLHHGVRALVHIADLHGMVASCNNEA